MKKIINSVTRLILTIMFVYHINQLISFYFGSIIPNPEEMKGAILIYFVIFILEIVLANLCTYFVFRVAKSEAK
ncbi:hypothetical protein JTF06_02965 [Desemzia sp. RIT804]|uniref:hypothetical protein n=1 Tax=Desemzia sp. RIT 804 TaxID=2810209 RepID=UPI001950B241|nr:hypothetical protein [Desemzia sp. RIT 804]MBM6613855.1 hypothetical protein [Desemzia sp. RIT 804]